MIFAALASCLIMVGMVFIIYRHKLRRIQIVNKALHQLSNSLSSILKEMSFSLRLNQSDIPEVDKIQHYVNQLLGKIQEIKAEHNLDLKELRRLQRVVAENVQRDRLTGLPNRHHFEEYLPNKLILSQTGKKAFALLIVDLDNFKVINDSLGYRQGDMLLQQISSRLSSLLSPHYYHCRLGGDEFCIIVDDIKAKDSISLLVEALKKTLDEPFEFADNLIPLYATIGVATYPKDGITESSLLRHADIALQEGKRKGKNCAVIFNPALAKTLDMRHLIESCLRSANFNKEFKLNFQPQFIIETGQLAGVEALLRWNSPKIGNVPPSNFIPIAEENGVIIELGTWVLREACKQAVIWQKTFQNLTVGINLSGRQLMQENLVSVVTQIIQDTGINPRLVELEVTETYLVNHLSDCIKRLNALKSLGIRISLDDFGTGFSSMAYLKKYPIDTLKIDRSFVEELHQNHEDQAITMAIVEMATALNVETIAEGVENKVQVAYLKAFGCNRVQGYLFGTPMTSMEIDSLLSAQAR